MSGSNNHQPQGELRLSVAGIIGLVISILALATSFLPIINNASAILAVVGIVFAIIGVVGTFRGKKRGKGLAIAGLILNFIAIAIVLGSQAAYSKAIDDAANGPSVASVSSDSSQGSNTDQASNQPSSKSDQGESETQKTTDLAVGTSVKLDNGLSVSVDAVEGGVTNYDGSKLVKATITYKNEGTEQATYNSFDWKGEDANGAQEMSEFYSGADGSQDESELQSGNLAAGGSKTGTVYFKEGTVKVVYFGTSLNNEAKASWKIA